MKKTRAPGAGRKPIPEAERPKPRTVRISDRDLAEIRERHGGLMVWVRWALRVMRGE